MRNWLPAIFCNIVLPLTCWRKHEKQAPLNLVGSSCDPCAKALQRTRVRLLAWVPLLRVTPPLLPCFLSHSSSYTVNKARKGQKKKESTRSITVMSQDECEPCELWLSEVVQYWNRQIKHEPRWWYWDFTVLNRLHTSVHAYKQPEDGRVLLSA